MQQGVCKKRLMVVTRRLMVGIKNIVEDQRCTLKELSQLLRHIDISSFYDGLS